MLKWDTESLVTFKADCTIAQLEMCFDLEDRQITFDDLISV